MKIATLLISSIMFLLTTQRLPIPDCVDYTCTCVSKDVRFIIKPICPNKAVNACYAKTTCKKQSDGKCDYTRTPAVNRCLALANGTGSSCMKTGCSGQICASHNVITTCDWRPEFACFKTAQCKIQAKTGQCGFTMTSQLLACLSGKGISQI
jgi:eight-cysteine-cluster-containing protein